MIFSYYYFNLQFNRRISPTWLPSQSSENQSLKYLVGDNIDCK